MTIATSTTVVHAGSTRYRRQLRSLRQSRRPAVLLAPSGLGRGAAAAEAESVAGSLGRRLQPVALDQVAGRYIGETEKNLALLLARADAAETILFFDEADSLFARRTGVRDAHDRHADQEVSHAFERFLKKCTVIVLAAAGRAEAGHPRLEGLRIIVSPPVRKKPAAGFGQRRRE